MQVQYCYYKQGVRLWNHCRIMSYLIHLTAMCYQISGIARGQRQIMHQMDNLNNLLRGSLGEKSQQTRTNKKNITTDSNSVAATVIVVVAVGCLGIFLMKGLLTRKWFLYMQKSWFSFTVTIPSGERRWSIYWQLKYRIWKQLIRVSESVLATWNFVT